jgi:hypothetical protein
MSATAYQPAAVPATNGAAYPNGTMEAPMTNGAAPAATDSSAHNKQAQKIEQLSEKDQKRQDKEQSKAVKAAHSDEKTVRKAQKAEEKSLKVRGVD